MLNAIRATPSNAQQISDQLKLDYTTVRHHLRVLEESGLVVAEGDSYGRVYFLSDTLENQWADLQGIIEKANKGGGR